MVHLFQVLKIIAIHSSLPNTKEAFSKIPRLSEGSNRGCIELFLKRLKSQVCRAFHHVIQMYIATLKAIFVYSWCTLYNYTRFERWIRYAATPPDEAKKRYKNRLGYSSC